MRDQEARVPSTRLFLRGLLVGVLFVGSTSAQAPSEQAKKVDEAISAVRSGTFLRYQIHLIGDAHAVRAIPDLEKRFGVEPDNMNKALLASVLIKLADRDNQYWDFLASSMDSILNNGAPDAVDFDAEGKHIPGPSPAFISWAKLHNLSPGDAAMEAVYILPGYFLLSALSEDVRAIPYLRRALESPNSQVAMFGAMGLAEFKDKDSISLIIARCKAAPTESRVALAESLIYFDDAEAQKAVDAFIPKETAKILREGRKQGFGPLHSPSE